MESGLALEPSPVVFYLGESKKPHCSALLGDRTAAGDCLVSILRGTPIGLGGAELIDNAANLFVLLNRAASTWGLL